METFSPLLLPPHLLSVEGERFECFSPCPHVVLAASLFRISYIVDSFKLVTGELIYVVESLLERSAVANMATYSHRYIEWDIDNARLRM
jgi:hypothetical protein